MRKSLKIIFTIITAVYFLKWLIPAKEYVNETYIDIAYAVLVIPYFTYELLQIRKDDRVNRTHVFRNRIYWMTGAVIVFAISTIYLNGSYPSK